MTAAVVDESAASAQYYLPRNFSESQRLERQHRILKQAFGNRILHPVVAADLASRPSVSILDSATGTGICLRDLVSSSPELTYDSLAAYDLSSAQFPPEEGRVVTVKGERKAIDFFKHSVLEPLPEEHRGKYDLTYQRLLVLGLRKDQWPTALENLKATLKPGGWLHLFEYDAYWQGQQLSDCISKTNLIGEGLEKMGNREFHMSEKAKEYLGNAGFINIQVHSLPIPVGATGLAEHGRQYAAESAANWRGIYSGTRGAWIAFGAEDRLPEGTKTDQEWENTMEQLEKDLNEKGARMVGSMIIAQAPA